MNMIEFKKIRRCVKGEVVTSQIGISRVGENQEQL